MIQKLNAKGAEISERHRRIVSTAGLCHDIGHGPFSHIFDGKFMPVVRPDLDFTHEEMGARLIDHMIDKNNLDWEREDIRMIQDLITGEYQSYPDEVKPLFDIVSNKRNSIDVDKMDYLLRDSYYVGIKEQGADCKRLMLGA